MAVLVVRKENKPGYPEGAVPPLRLLGPASHTPPAVSIMGPSRLALAYSILANHVPGRSA